MMKHGAWLALALASCGGDDGARDELSLSNKIGANAILERAPLEEVQSGHVPNNRGVPFGQMWFKTPFEPAHGYIMVDFYEPPGTRTYNIVIKQFTELQPGDATLEYSEGDSAGSRAFRGKSGTVEMTVSGDAITIDIVNAPMEPDPVSAFDEGVGTFELSSHMRTTSYDPD
jgi:hypothetical protein